METVSDRHLIGLISDTHGLLRPSVHSAFAGVELILHAGDVGDADVLHELRTIAPVHAVFGNTDPVGAPDLHQEVTLTIGGLTVHVSHGHEVGIPTPAKMRARYAEDVIVYGHTHRQVIAVVAGRLVVNPGAAGARRFNLEASVGRLTIAGGRAEVEIVALD